ncbi:hypothetical protein [Acinetobacter wanghuae]|uniref:hypothetical protein n=1 Tax=Acinetobacter wanghuae TaxID=2662362 RepID=UPI003AF4FD01
MMYKGVLLLCMLLSTACSYFVSIEELAQYVELQMQREFNANTEYKKYHLIVEDVQITERKGNEFKAISKLKYQGQPFVIDVNIQKSKTGFSWRIAEEAFTFIDEIEIEKYRQQLDRELEQITLSLEQDDLSAKVSVQPENFATGAMAQGSLAQQEQTMPNSNHNEKPYPVGNINAYTQ